MSKFREAINAITENGNWRDYQDADEVIKKYKIKEIEFPETFRCFITVLIICGDDQRELLLADFLEVYDDLTYYLF